MDRFLVKNDPFAKVVSKPQSKLEDFFGPNPVRVRTTPANVQPILPRPKFKDPNTGDDYQRELHFVQFSDVYLYGAYDTYRQLAIDYLNEQKSGLTPARIAMYANKFYAEDQRKIQPQMADDLDFIFKLPQ